MGFANPADQKVGQLILRLWALQYFFIFKNNFPANFYFRLDSTFHSTLRFSTCVPQRFASDPPAIRDKYYAKREKFGLSALLSRTKRQGGGGRWRRASGDWHSTHATRGKRRRFAPPFPPCCIRRRIVTFSESGRSGLAEHFVSQASLGRLSQPGGQRRRVGC